MKRKLMILIPVIIMLFSVISISDISKSEENEFVYDGVSFIYYNPSFSTVYPAIIVHCDYPDDMPHKHFPYSWNPTYYEYTDDVLLDIPGEEGSLAGSFGNNTFMFYLEYSSPVEGEYTVTVVEDSINFVSTYNFSMYKQLTANITSAKWIVPASSGAVTYENQVDKNKIGSIRGIQFVVYIENLGDIPVFSGYQGQKTISASYQINLYKNGVTEPIYSGDTVDLIRRSSLFKEGDNNNEKCFFKPGDIYKYDDVVDVNFPSLKEYGAGTYSISGQVIFGDTICDFYCDNILTIEDSSGIPGFELIFLVCAMAIIIIWRWKR